jgi:hypothetical protein
MNKEFIPYEQALELKELGFSYQCFAAQKYNLIDYGSEMYDFIYNADLTDKTDGWVALPLYQQAFRWFREKHGLMGLVDCFLYPFSYTYNINDIINEKIILWSEPENDFETYEEAEKALLIKLIELVKQN